MFVTSEKGFWKNVYYLYIFIEHFDKKIGKIKIDKNLDADKINQIIKDGLIANSLQNTPTIS